MAKYPQFTTPPPTFDGKVPMVARGGVDEAVLARAEQAVAALADQYGTWVSKDQDQLEIHLKALIRNPQRHDKILPLLFKCAHDMKGQGSLFGYDLITRIGNSLCRFIEMIPAEPGPDELQVITLHVQSMRVVVTEQLTDDGGTQGQELIEGLHRVLERHGSDL
ncbi:MAG: Hpt domain-containing protein [Rhodospirillaceae bacterium]